VQKSLHWHIILQVEGTIRNFKVGLQIKKVGNKVEAVKKEEDSYRYLIPTSVYNHDRIYL